MDYCKCKGTKCPLKEKCYRHTGPDYEDGQSYFLTPPYNHEEKGCGFFWDNQDGKKASVKHRQHKAGGVPARHHKQEKNKMKYIVRTYSAGVFYGEIVSRKGKEVVMKDARRLWYWSGASSLSQLAMEGVKRPEECKFPCVVSRVELLEVIEILDTTEMAQKSIESVAIWKQ